MASRRDYFEPDSFDKGLLAVKAKGYKINETDKEIVGQVDAILVLPNKLEGGADKREDKALGFRLFLIHSITI
jgi:gamma-glutamyltranspeptidase/glutathione hydrolase